MFRAVESAGHPFPPCDTTGPDSTKIRIRPVEANLGGKTASGVAAGVNVTSWAIPPALILAFNNPLFILVPAIQMTPGARILYRIDYPDSAGRVESESLSVEGNPWFKSRARNRNLLMEQSRREISARLFGAIYPPEPEPWGRVSLNYSGLLFYRDNDGFNIEPRLEKFLRRDFALALSTGLKIPDADGQRAYWIYGGPRKYFGKNHDGLYLGVEPLFYAARDGGWDRLAGVPLSFGHVKQHERISIGFGIGLGPGYRWAPPAFPESDGFQWVGMFDMSLGFRF